MPKGYLERVNYKSYQPIKFSTFAFVWFPKVKEKVLRVRMDKKEFKIIGLGEGIQSIILITLPLFLYLEKFKEENTMF